MFKTIMMTFSLGLSDKTDVDHNTRTYAEFHKAVQRYPSKEIDNFDVILFHFCYMKSCHCVALLLCEFIDS